MNAATTYCAAAALYRNKAAVLVLVTAGPQDTRHASPVVFQTRWKYVARRCPERACSYAWLRPRGAIESWRHAPLLPLPLGQIQTGARTRKREGSTVGTSQSAAASFDMCLAARDLGEARAWQSMVRLSVHGKGEGEGRDASWSGCAE